MSTVRIGVGILAVALLGGCPKNVPQSSKTGKDGKSSGAKVVKIEENEGSAKGIVTYPGGDRVDWKVFEITQKGDVEVSLKWKPPREGLDLSMNLLDEGMTVLQKVKPAKGSGKIRKKIDAKNLEPGKYYVQIYASERGDAGAYTLSVTWNEPEEVEGGAQVDAIPLPPRLAAIPAPPPPVDPNKPPDVPIVPPVDPNKPPEDTKPKVKPVKAKILEVSTSDRDVLVILDVGKAAGVDSKWEGKIYKGTGTGMLTKSPVDLVIIKVGEDESTARIMRLSVTELGDNKRVVLTPPAATE
jgi:hypothetical protein